MVAPPKWLVAVYLCAVAIPSASVDQSIEDAWLDIHSEATQSAVREREARILEELAGAELDEWTGEYQFGDGLGVNVRLLFAPKAGFVYSWSGCFGQYDLNYGGIEWRKNGLSLRLERPYKHEAHRGLPSELIPVRWGERHYLIAPDNMINFANAVNAGFEPCPPCLRFLLKTGDEHKAVAGGPDLPDQFKHYLLEEPIDARVLSLGETRAGEERITRLIVDKGSMHGMFPGMKLHASQPRYLLAEIIVTRVDTQASEITIEQFDPDDPLPSLDWTFSTRATAGDTLD